MPSAEYQRAWRLRNPGKQAAYCHKYLETHREERNARGRERYHRSDGKGYAAQWRQRNPEKFKAAKRRYRAKADTRAKERTYDRRWRALNPERLLLAQARRRARQMGIAFSLQQSDVRIPSECPVLGMRRAKGWGKLRPNSPTLDRIDNGKG